MSKSDGTRFRAQFEGNMSGLLDVMVQQHGDQDIEVQMLVERIRDLVLASETKDPTALREPLLALLRVMGTRAPVFDTNPYARQVLLFGRTFATVAMTVVNVDEELEALNAVDHDFENVMGKVTSPNGPESSPILPQPIVEAASEEQKPIRMSAKRKLVFTVEETPTTPKRNLKIPKEEDGTPIIIAPKRRSSRRSGVVEESVADSSRFHPIEVKVEVVDDNSEKKKCDHCNLEVRVSEMEQLKHKWKKHKNLVYKHIRPELVCTIDYCDYVSPSATGRKIHVGKTHGIKPLVQRRVVSELKASKCPYCASEIDTIVSLKQHVLQCTERDERPMLGCSACPGLSFHFIYDFTAHLKKFGGVAHGKPTLLSNE
ncbi:hypothetical protein PRIPAC_93299 [Pristionchus pacificus]|uniref:Uncharacterized protein n=1 Tax=Pristionchus pacificus TaxID=54126 RepID=A0A2A6BB03_PRIPA|nr:hypothetical protein PRIPAC_93299 [Pristionchus pacificus]|eukprot:PDM63044.1 hypothetical protein PRIPAC_50259 [Pristionchus pacificus]